MDLADLEQQRLAAIVAGDGYELERLHADDFVLCTPSGQIWDRATYLDGLRSGEIDYHRFQPITPIETAVGTAIAAVRYKSSIDISIDHRAVGHLECWHLDVYSHDPRHGWRCKWSQATDSIVD